MKNKYLIRTILILLLTGWILPSFGGEATGPKAEMGTLFGKIQTKLGEGKRTKEDLADELKQFDALIEKYQDQKTDDVAQILFMKGMLYMQVFDDPETGLTVIKQIEKDYPETEVGGRAKQMIPRIEQMVSAKKVRSQLTIGSPFPDFKENDLDGKPLSVAKYKGKVVLIDFWATWCGPCINELPNVLETYEKWHDKGFEIIGISLDNKKEKLTSFIKKRKMPWPQFFDGNGWDNKLAAHYGVKSIPATYLLDTKGNIAAKDLRGPALEKTVSNLLEKK